MEFLEENFGYLLEKPDDKLLKKKQSNGNQHHQNTSPAKKIIDNSA